MKQLIILWMSVMLLRFTGARYPECNGVSCPDGSVPLSSLSYNTIRSNVFNGTQPSNEGCTNGVSIDGQMTIECGQGTTLIDCNRGFNGGDYSDLSRTFAWNRTSSVAEQVSIVFRFSQQVNISRIIMFFWNSPNNSIIIPNVRLYWSNDDSITPSNEINITPKSVKRIDDERRRWFIDINDNRLQFQYLRIEMSFYDDSEWIFLGEVAFCGNTAPYHITQPSTDNEVQIVSPTATMATLTCSLNITIPSTVMVIWLHNGSVVMTTPPNGITTTLQLENLQPSDAGVYQCVFNDTVGYVLRRSTNLLIIDPQIIQPPVNFITVFFDESTSFVQLTCSLNINIPSSVTVTWIYRGFLIIIEPPYEVITVDNNTTLVIHNPQPSNVGDYQCLFMGLDLQRRPLITLDIRCVIISAPANGEILSCSSGTVGVGSEGGTCSFACNTGYELIGSDTRTCQSNGSWSGTDIICSRVRCPSLTNPGNRIANCSLGDDGIFSYEDVCSFTCNAGYEPVDSTERACQSDGSWSGSPLSCTIMECPSLSLPMNSMLAESCSSTYQSMCELQCPEGFTGTGDSLYVCDVLSNGSSVMWMAKGNAWKCEKASNNSGRSSDSSVVIGGAIAGIVLLLIIVIVPLCIVILCMRKCNRDGKSPVDDKVFNDATKLNTKVSVKSNRVYDASAADHFYEIIEPPNSHVPITANPSYSVHSKPYSEGRDDDYNYVQLNEFNQRLDLEGTIKMDTNPSYAKSSYPTK